MQLRYTILYVENVVDTMTFYQNAFGLERLMLHESNEYGELNTGDTKLAFASINLINELGKSAVKPDSNKPTFEIAFETENVEQALAKAINAGATLIQEAREEPWGQTTSYVSDMNGFLVEICSPIDNQSK